MCPPQINVYACYPLAVELGSDLNVDPSNWHWVHCLTIPLETLNTLQFSQRPYKWIRYAIGIVVGVEGNLSSSSDFHNTVDYNAGLPAEFTTLFYHTSDEEKRRMFPLDPDMGHTNVTASVATTRREKFCDEVAVRDGRQCVLTRLEYVSCDAVHLLAHNKGHMYISTYTQRRSRDPTRGDIIQDINDVRNGLFLNAVSHRSLGKDFAFLMTPNFAMNTTDIDPTIPQAEKRCTAHLFRPGALTLLAPSGTPLRISDTPDWPPAILFDAVYADAVLHNFGTQELKDGVAATWKNIFYPGGVRTSTKADYKAVTDERATAMERTQSQAQERTARYETRSGPDILDILMTLPYILVPQNELQAMSRAAKEKAEAAEQKRVHEKVDTWMCQITSDSN